MASCACSSDGVVDEHDVGHLTGGGDDGRALGHHLPAALEELIELQPRHAFDGGRRRQGDEVVGIDLVTACGDR